MNKLKSSKLIITLSILILLIIGWNFKVMAEILPPTVLCDGHYLCNERGEPFHAKSGLQEIGPDYPIPYKYRIKIPEYNDKDDPTHKTGWHWSSFELNDTSLKEADIENNFDSADGGIYASYLRNSESCRKAAFMLYSNEGRTSVTDPETNPVQMWWWNSKLSAEYSCSTEPNTDEPIPSFLQNKMQQASAKKSEQMTNGIAILAASKSDDTNNVSETEEIGQDSETEVPTNDMDTNTQSLNASENSSSLSEDADKYIKVTKDPWIENMYELEGEKSSYNDIIGPLKVDYEPTEEWLKKIKVGKDFYDKNVKTYLSGVVILYKDGSYIEIKTEKPEKDRFETPISERTIINTDGIKIKQNGKEFENPAEIERNMDFYVVNPYIDKEVKSIGIKIEKKVKVYVADLTIKNGTKADVKNAEDKIHEEHPDALITTIGPMKTGPQDLIYIIKAVEVDYAYNDIELPVRIKRGDIELTKKGVYKDSESGEQKEEPLPNVKFKVYCNELEKFIESVELWDENVPDDEKSYRITYTEDINKAKVYETQIAEDGTAKVLIQHLYAGKDTDVENTGGKYSYKLIEVDGGENSYYIDPLKIESGVSTHSGEIPDPDITTGHYSVDENTKYCTIENVTVYYDDEGGTEGLGQRIKTYILIEDDRTSADLLIEKVDETYQEEVKLEGAQFKVKLVKSEEYLDENGVSDPDHNLDISNKWLKVIDSTLLEDGTRVYDYSKLLHDDYLLNEEPSETFVTGTNGRISILCVINGTYEMYEVKSSRGYDLTRQWEYVNEDANHEEWADYGTTEISTDKNHFDNRLTNRKVVKIDGNIWEDIRDELKDGSKYRSLNGDSVDKLIPEEVQVNLWVSETKLDNIIKTSARRLDPAFKDGLEIKDGFVKVAYTMSDKETGKWEINRLKQVGPVSNEKPKEQDIYYWDLTDAYIEFVYNNETYVCVDPFAMIEDTQMSSQEIRQKSIPKNSKAIEYELDKDELNDMNLTGVSGAIPGSAVTKQKATWGNGNSETMSPTDILNFNWDTLNEGNTDYKYDLDELGLTGYYNPDRYYVENINLGLWRKKEPQYLVQQTLEYSKILMNGYTYTYDYVHGTNGKVDVTATDMVPATYEQVGKNVYGAKIYPSDIAYTAENGVTENKGMRMFVVYKIDVINPEVPTDIEDNIYDEVRLYVTKLTNTFDSRKYTVSADHRKDTNWEGSQYFGLWDTQENQEGFATANYRIKDDENEVDTGYDQLSDGILPANENNSSVESVYIQFEVNELFLKAILSGNLEEYDDKVAISQAHTVAHHAYTREDNTWKDYDEVSAEESYYENEEDGTKLSRESDEAQASVARKTNREEDNNEKRHTFLHRSKDVPNDAGALGVLFTLGEQRTISGTVFEDLDESGDEENKGNGILDEKETNRGQNVKVELIDAETGENAFLYQRDPDVEKQNYEEVDTANVETRTNSEGKYEFVGVVPGVYRLRFTYSDEKTVMKDANPLTSNDYKSTILNIANGEAGENLRKAEEYSEGKSGEGNSNNKIEVESKDLKETLEWYKQIYNIPNAPKYNVSTDDFKTRVEMETHEYSEEESQGSYKPLMESYTPFFSISVENDVDDKRSVDTSAYEGEDKAYYELGHRYWYEGFNLGLIKTTETNITLDKIISDVKLTTSSGTTLVQGNPREALNYITALDEIKDGSKYVRVEMPSDNIYGTALETKYKITIKDNLNSVKNNKDYIEDVGNEYYGYYFKYGDKVGEPHLVQTKVNEVIDEMDSNYDLLNSTLAEKTYHPFEAENVENEDGENKETPVTVTVEEGRLVLTDWEPLEVGGYTQVEYTANGIFRDDMDLSYNNNARITKIQLDKTQILRTECTSWRETSDTRLIATADTGEDRSSTYYVIGIMSLLILGAGIVIIKGIVSKKQD